ncbi:uncharacterized protein LOC119684924 [Teleopsis dalmanni]|uniref:uncharacterized protein LOC119684924 n=1 Tax=Teleopsis dalmanni TaxID=139649 RepID=UPI0018CEE82A|nr:uncharacterized protein LOC119684924 [Teleopsis dalmanni]
MFTYRIIFVCLLASLLSAHINALRIAIPQNLTTVDESLLTVCPKPCFLSIRCNIYANATPIWVQVDGICRPILNRCVFITDQCQRQNDCLPEMVETVQDVCQQNCVTTCDNAGNIPVCAFISYPLSNGQTSQVSLTFPNQCELDKWSCATETAYLNSRVGTCT